MADLLVRLHDAFDFLWIPYGSRTVCMDNVAVDVEWTGIDDLYGTK